MLLAVQEVTGIIEMDIGGRGAPLALLVRALDVLTPDPALQPHQAYRRQMGQVSEADPGIPICMRSVKMACSLLEGAAQFFCDESGTQGAIDAV
ncbi:hypothetical protein [Deinococcus marmoris]|uniref:hypothetical protein n=1 Tax=Deinococcus marmoris TaxID=249408 RepID=UPI000497C79C|nr:hypothetical protein [Deinococcus marmoris]